MNQSLSSVLIISGGEGSPRTLKNILLGGLKPFIICADSGADYALEAGLTPSVVIGDLDSISPQSLEALRKRNVRIIKHPEDKELTDLELALDFAIGQGVMDISITCSTGNRLDHTLGNVFVIAQTKYDSARITMIEDSSYGVLLKPLREETIKGALGDIISLTPLSPTILIKRFHGVKWELNDTEILFGTTRTISNQFTRESANIFLERGRCLVTHYKNA